MTDDGPNSASHHQIRLATEPLNALGIGVVDRLHPGLGLLG